MAGGERGALMRVAMVSVGRWTLATWLGWVVGVPILIALALILEALGFEQIQFPVGVAMGLGVGLLQGRIVRRLGISFGDWISSCAVGLAIPFAAFDVGTRFGYYLPHALYVCVGLGGLIVGTWQAYLLRSHLRAAGVWVVASVLGWTAAAGSAAAADLLVKSHSVTGIPGALAYLGIVMAGGVILGVVTGLVLAQQTVIGSATS